METVRQDVSGISSAWQDWDTPEWTAGDADDPLLVRKVIDHYHEALGGNAAAQAYLAHRRLDDPAVINAFHIGYGDRSLGEALGDGRTPEGGAMRGYLQRVGLLRPLGQELFWGYLTFPSLDDEGFVSDVYGRKIRRVRSGAVAHRSLPVEPGALFHTKALACGSQVILCKSPLEAASVWRMGCPDVVATLGIRPFSDRYLETIVACGIERILVAFDSTAAGDRAAELVAQALESVGVECLRVRFPEGMDANGFWCSGGDAAAFSALLRQARPVRTAARTLFGRARRWH